MCKHKVKQENRNISEKSFFEIVLEEPDQKIVKKLLQELKKHPKNKKLPKKLEQKISDVSLAIILSTQNTHKACAEIYHLFGRHTYSTKLSDAFRIASSLGELPPTQWEADDEYLPKKYQGKNYFELKKIMEETFQKTIPTLSQ